MARFQIHFLDMGDTKFGDCLVVEAGSRRILIDGGHSTDFEGQDGYDSIPDQIEGLIGPPPFKFDLLVVTHVHADHIGCLPKMFDAGLLKIKTALVADEKLGFGHVDGGPDFLNDGSLTPLERGLIAAGTEQDYSDLSSDEIIAFLLDAANLEDSYKKFLKDLTASGTKVIRYVGQSMAQFEKKFSNIGLKVLGPPRDHLERCAKATAKAEAANARRSGGPDAAVPDALNIVERYGQMHAARAQADAELAPDLAIDAFPRDGKNNSSIVLALAVSGKAALLAGDMQFADPLIPGMEQDMLNIRQVVRQNGPYQLVKTSHHTSFNGVTPEVLGDYPGCKLFVHSGGRRDPNHPEKDALAAMKAKALADNIKYARTDRNGLITVKLAPGAPSLMLTQGKVNVFTRNPKNAPDDLVAVAAPPQPELESVVHVEPGAIEHVEVLTRIPNQQTRVTVTVDVDPASGPDRSGVPTDRRSLQRSSGSLRIAGGRSLPRLLFVTEPGQLARNIGRDEAREVLAAVTASADVLNLRPGTTDSNDAAAEVRARLPGGYKGVVLLGGYDVVPPSRLDTIGDEIRARLAANPDNGEDPDDFFVWSDDGYVDLNGDGRPELPVSRIPDGMNAGLVRNALEAGAAGANGKFGIRNSLRPFADGVWAVIPGGNALDQSHPITADQIHAGSLKNAHLYFMLHGDSANGKRFTGENRQREHLTAIDVDAVKDAGGAVVFAGACWGALCGERLAREPGPVIPRALGNSLAMKFLLGGARAFVGCTGVHYSPGAGEDAAGGPMHEAFWRAMANGAAGPAEALLQAKRVYARRLQNTRRALALRAIENKICAEFTCLGLGW